jgi:hypothetical protein
MKEKGFLEHVAIASTTMSLIPAKLSCRTFNLQVNR